MNSSRTLSYLSFLIARGADREQIRTCSELGLSLEEFLGYGLEAMQEIFEALEL